MNKAREGTYLKALRREEYEGQTRILDCSGPQEERKREVRRETGELEHAGSHKTRVKEYRLYFTYDTRLLLVFEQEKWHDLIYVFKSSAWLLCGKERIGAYRDSRGIGESSR